MVPRHAPPSDPVRRLEDKLLGESRASTIRGELASGRGSSRHNLVFGRSRGGLTMMQSCASAAKLRAAGPFSKTVSNHGLLRVTANSDRQRGPAKSRFPGSGGLSAFSFHAARKTTPAGTSPVVT